MGDFHDLGWPRQASTSWQASIGERGVHRSKRRRNESTGPSSYGLIKSEKGKSIDLPVHSSTVFGPSSQIGLLLCSAQATNP